MTRTYSTLIRFDNFYDRFDYLRLGGRVGSESFGFDRYLNQKFYTSDEWRKFRRDIIIRDNGCDLADPDFEIPNGVGIVIHHINPIEPSDILDRNMKVLLNPENVVCVSPNTHEAIHYGDQSLLPRLVERTPGDTKLW